MGGISDMFYLTLLFVTFRGHISELVNEFPTGNEREHHIRYVEILYARSVNFNALCLQCYNLLSIYIVIFIHIYL